MTAVATTAPVAVAPHEADPLAARRAAPVPDQPRSCWLFPLLWAIYTALRPYSDTAGQRLRLDRAEPHARQLHLRLERRRSSPQYFLNTLIVAVPAVIVTLFSSSMLGVRRSRASASS